MNAQQFQDQISKLESTFREQQERKSAKDEKRAKVITRELDKLDHEIEKLQKVHAQKTRQLMEALREPLQIRARVKRPTSPAVLTKRDAYTRVLKACGGNVSRAARELGVSYGAVYYATRGR